MIVELIFLSTPSGWRATRRPELDKLYNAISIHALRVEGDYPCAYYLCQHKYFYPRPPGGGRQEFVFCDCRVILISIHALRVEGDATVAVHH